MTTESRRRRQNVNLTKSNHLRALLLLSGHLINKEEINSSAVFSIITPRLARSVQWNVLFFFGASNQIGFLSETRNFYFGERCNNKINYNLLNLFIPEQRILPYLLAG